MMKPRSTCLRLAGRCLLSVRALALVSSLPIKKARELLISVVSESLNAVSLPIQYCPISARTLFISHLSVLVIFYITVTLEPTLTLF